MRNIVVIPNDSVLSAAHENRPEVVTTGDQRVLLSAGGKHVSQNKEACFGSAVFQGIARLEACGEGLCWHRSQRSKTRDYNEGDSNEPEGLPEPPLFFRLWLLSLNSCGQHGKQFQPERKPKGREEDAPILRPGQTVKRTYTFAI